MRLSRMQQEIAKMKKFKCPKCDNDTVVETIQRVIEYRTFWKIDQDGYSPDYQDYEYDYDEAETLDFVCKQCGYYLGNNLEDMIDTWFEERDDDN